ncbi:MAG: CDP-glycerol glycerophosphotransferase family protein, partial [Lachnospiraceae bacterium]|nr:CDP-glycerol glycerophosphotransferase family protein [Lachnospiraceae bacterium]
VTSVHPFFFSDNLKKFTDKLIYIPYFVLGEIKPDEDEKIEGMKHFCTVPGVYNADKVIVQSEDMRQVYIKVLMDASNDHSEAARKYLEDKILGLGSPKFDKVANTKKEDIEMPKEWLKIIRKPDGSWKKIIFYNTSIAGLLHHNEKMIAKMKYVFQVFKENQDEVALLWRPHPLIKATVESMRPQLWIEYDQLVKKYLEEGWGIYDDTADIDRAIEISDAYYGDASSVVQLYQQTGKPIMMQNVDIVT